MCHDDKPGSLEVYMLCVMMIGLEGWKFRRLHAVCDDDKSRRLDVWKFTHCVG